MAKFVRSTADEVKRMLAEGGDRTDWAAVRALTPADIERLADKEDGPLPEGWEATVVTGLPNRARTVK